MTRRILALAAAALLLLLAGGSVAAQGGGYARSSFYGEPGSVTINGKAAPPGTQIVVGVGPAPEELVSGTSVMPDSSWEIGLLVVWEEVHLFVDGFRVPGGPFDVPESGGTREMRLDVGVETDPSPGIIFFHARSEDVTLFGQPLPAGAEITTWVDDKRIWSDLYYEGGVWSGQVPTGAEEVSFTINGFPVAGGPYTADPADAPFWITLHADDPDHLPFRFHGPPGDVVDLRPLCGSDQLWPLWVVGFNNERWDRGWQHTVQVEADGSWTLDAPSGTQRIEFFVSPWTHIRPERPRRPQQYEALPAGGGRLVRLGHTETPIYLFYGDTPPARDERGSDEAISRIEVRRGRVVLGAEQVRRGDEYGIGVPYGTLGVSLWVDDQHAGGRLHNAIAGEPDLKYGSTCAKRVDLQLPTRGAPAHPPDLLRRLERLFSGAGSAGRAALE